MALTDKQLRTGAMRSVDCVVLFGIPGTVCAFIPGWDMAWAVLTGLSYLSLIAMMLFNRQLGRRERRTR